MAKNKQPAILIILICVTLAFIWIQSILGGDISSAESGWVRKLVSPVLELIFGKGNVTDHLVRKLAHFSEYTVFGVELAFLFRNARFKGLPIIFFHGLGVAFIDETIQIFSGRGPEIVDVWIDLGGAVFGAVIGILIRMIKAKDES